MTYDFAVGLRVHFLLLVPFQFMALTVLMKSYDINCIKPFVLYLCVCGLDILYKEWCQFCTLSTNRLRTLELNSFYLCIYLIRFHQIFTKLNLTFNCKQFQCKILPFTICFTLPFFFLLVCAVHGMGSYFPYQGSNLGPQQWKYSVLTTGLPGNSLILPF